RRSLFRMFNRYRRLSAFKLSEHRVQNVFVFLFLGTALILAVVGAFAMVQAESSVQASSWNPLTAQITPQTLFMMMEQEIPYLRTEQDHASLEEIMPRFFFEFIASVNPKDP